MALYNSDSDPQWRDTQRLFESVWGADAAKRWTWENAGKQGSWEAFRDGTASAASSSSNIPYADTRDAWIESANSAAQAEADRNATSRYASDASAGASRYATKTSSATDRYIAGLNNTTQRYGIDTTADTTRYGIDTTAGTNRYVADLNNSTDRYVVDATTGASRYVADVNSGTDRYVADVESGTDRYVADVGARTAAEELAQLQRQFDATLAFKMKELAAERERIAIERGRAEADKWYQEQQVRLADETHQLAVSQLGLDYLKTDVEFRSSPDNYFKLADFEAGARERQDVPIFLQNLQAGQAGAAYAAPGGAPTAQSIGSGVAALGGGLAPGVPGAAGTPGQGQAAGASGIPGAAGSAGTAGWSAQDVSALSSIAQINNQGAHKLAPGALEGLSSDNRALLGAGIARLGGSPRAFSEAYLRSRPGQGNAMVA